MSLSSKDLLSMTGQLGGEVLSAMLAVSLAPVPVSLAQWTFFGTSSCLVEEGEESPKVRKRSSTYTIHVSYYLAKVNDKPSLQPLLLISSALLVNNGGTA